MILLLPVRLIFPANYQQVPGVKQMIDQIFAFGKNRSAKYTGLYIIVIHGECI